MKKERKGLSSFHHDKLSDFLGEILDGYKNGTIKKIEALGKLAHFIAAVDMDEQAEIESCLKK